MVRSRVPRGEQIAAVSVIFCAAVWAADEPKPDPATLELFEKQVRPVLMTQCASCHGEQQQFSSLRVDSREALLKGGNRGPALIPGDPVKSLLARAVRHDGLKMPVGGQLAPAQIAAIEKWIERGAPWPDSGAAAVSGNPKLGPRAPGFYEKIRKEHWAYQPVRDPAPPAVPGVSHPVDQFLQAALKTAGLSPAPRADRPTLIRRLSFTLTGLPPTPLEIDLFVKDTAPGAYERLVDRLLASPHFGEQWARHWMDVMRFAETFGNDWNYEIKGSWLYRDYLIRAFNQDVPYDQLVREHLAGDLLDKPRINAKEKLNESILGTSFLRMGELGHDDCIRFRQIRTDVVDNQIDTLGKAFQGLTIACARCHDHKLDPIPTSDYYGLYGALTSSRMVMRNAGLPSAADAPKARLSQLKPQIREELAKAWTTETRLIPRYLLAADRAWKGLPPLPADLTELSLEKIQAWVSLLEKQKPALEDPLYPWIGKENWQELKQRYETESASRQAFNRENFRPFGDLNRDGFGGWHADGNALTGGPSPAGEFAVSGEGSTAVTGIFPAGIYTNALSERLNGALRSPFLPKDKKFLSVQVMGGKLGAWRTIIDNCMLSEDYQPLDHNSLQWLKVPNRTDQPTLPFYLELVTKADNPRIPDRPGRLKVNQQQLDSPYSYFGIARAVLHDVDEAPRDELSHMLRLFAGNLPDSAEQKANRYASAVSSALENWRTGKASDDDAHWLEWLLENKLLSNNTELTPRLAELIQEYRLTETRIDAPKTFEGLADLDPGYDFPVLPAGDAMSPGRVVPRGFLELVSPSSEKMKVFGSGRLEIADLITAKTNPLTARVMANRIWLHVFGKGIVNTADNFGTYGEPPSNPELLDYLATRFVREGWSIKKQIRFLVLSDAFQQSSRTTPEAQKEDPLNRLLSHYPIRRLEGESIRDAILSVSGRLDPSLYGPPVQPHREEPKDYRKLFQGPLDGDGRRSIYIKVTRHEGSRFLEIFDFPNPTVARGNRDSTNVPPQALALMNDPFVIEQANLWAEHVIAQKAPSPEARLDGMFRTALGRLPDEAERARFLSMASETASLRHLESGKLMESREVWKDVAHAIFNLKEFIYVR